MVSARVTSILLTGALVMRMAPLLQAAEVGPTKGALVVVGGNMQDERIVKRFIDLAGGSDAPIVVIPTAGGAENYDQYWQGLRQFKNAGAKNLTVLHTYDRAVADTEKFVEPLTHARGVIGGSSAGATIIGSFLVRGDTKGNETMIGDHTAGLGFLKNVGIDQHLLKRNRVFDMLEVIRAYPNLLKIGIDEDTAIVVEGDQFEVIGKSYVVIYDNQRQIPPNGSFYFLAAGDRYNLKTREATRPTPRLEPIDRVKRISPQK